MSVHYKFKSTLEFDTITFDGLHISVGDLKKAIVHQKHLGKVSDFDLQITNAQTRECYEDDATLIPKNTSLIISRIPIQAQTKKSWNEQSSEKLLSFRNVKTDGAALDLFKMNGSEEEKIQEMIAQSTADYDPKNYHKIRGQTQIGEVPSTYRCNKCKKGGHWIKNCPFSVGKDHSEARRNAGIPKSFREKASKETVQATEVFEDVIKNKEIPEQLICNICKDLFVDAVMIPCCGSSFCDECIRNALLESEDNECPDCGEKGSSPGSLIPNRFLRNSVNIFKSESGYKITTSKKENKLKKVTQKKDTVPDNAASTTEIEISKELSNSSKSEAADEYNENAPVSFNPGNKNSNTSTSNEKVPLLAAPNISLGTGAATIDKEGSKLESKSNEKLPTSQIETRSSDRSHLSHLQPPGIEHVHYDISPKVKESEEGRKSPRLPSKTLQRNDRDCNSDREYCEIPSKVLLPNKDIPMKHFNPQHPERGFRQCTIDNPIHSMRAGYAPEVFCGPTGGEICVYDQAMPNQQVPVQGQLTRPFVSMYNQVENTMNMAYSNCLRPVFQNARPVYVPPPMRDICSNVRHMPEGSFASVYQGVAAKIGSGVIDDPLEAFNRLMREKETRKEEHRRTENRRSWSNERQSSSRVRSSPYRQSTKDRKRYNSRDKDNRRDIEKRHQHEKASHFRRSRSLSDQSIRSKSWLSSPQRKYSRSPYDRRSRSRARIFGDKYRQHEKDPITRKGEAREASSRNRDKTPIYQSTNKKSHQMSSSIAFVDSKKGKERSPSGYRYLSPRQQPEFQVKSQEKESHERKRLEDSSFDKFEPPPPGFDSNVLDNFDRNSFKSSDLSKQISRKRSNSPEIKKKHHYISSVSHDKSDEPNYKKCRLENDPSRSHIIRSDDKMSKKIKPSKNGKDEEHLLKESYIMSLETSKKYGLLQQTVESHRMKPESPSVELSKQVRDKKDRRKKKKEKIEKKKPKKDKKESFDREREQERASTSEERTPKIPPSTACDIEIRQESISPNGDEKRSSNELSYESNNSKLMALAHPLADEHSEHSVINKQMRKDVIAIPMVPEVSKWECDEKHHLSDQYAVEQDYKGQENTSKENDVEVTSEVLKKAENAIFARAIKAIQPHDGMSIKKGSSKSSNATKNESSPSPKGLSQDTSNDSIKYFKITIPTSSNQERSVEIKSNSEKNFRNADPIGKSAKSRLGSKIYSEKPSSYSSNKNTREDRKESKSMSSSHRSKDNANEKLHEGKFRKNDNCKSSFSRYYTDKHFQRPKQNTVIHTSSSRSRSRRYSDTHHSRKEKRSMSKEREEADEKRDDREETKQTHRSIDSISKGKNNSIENAPAPCRSSEMKLYKNNSSNLKLDLETDVSDDRREKRKYKKERKHSKQHSSDETISSGKRKSKKRNKSSKKKKKNKK